MGDRKHWREIRVAYVPVRRNDVTEVTFYHAQVNSCSAVVDSARQWSS